jgi:hypothetical protein
MVRKKSWSFYSQIYGYSYNKRSVITNLPCRGFLIELKGGLKNK